MDAYGGVIAPSHVHMGVDKSRTVGTGSSLHSETCTVDQKKIHDDAQAMSQHNHLYGEPLGEMYSSTSEI